MQEGSLDTAGARGAPRTAQALAQALVDARDYTKRAYAHLAAGQQDFPQIPLVNLPRWELGHVGWFQEFWCRRFRADDPEGAATPSRIAQADGWWNSSRVAHATRWTLALPDWPGIHAYLDATLADTLHALERRGDDDLYFFELSLYHEDMHAEALVMTLQTLGLPPPAWVAAPAEDARAEAAPPAADVAFGGGAFHHGAARGDERTRFVFDNEKWGEAVRVAPFAIAARCVTNAEFAAFVDDGGYRRRGLWTPAGLAWLAENGAAHPAYWRRAEGGWEQRWFDRWRPLAPGAPAMHVNAHEAEAYCTWAGRRLPTEVEWEYAAAAAPWPQDANLDHRRGHPVAAAAPGPGLAHVFGNVWEWTATDFVPFAGFAPDPYADYSRPWFHDHRVIRGGSFATRSRLVHARFRNFYRPARSDMFVGFRTCAP